MEVQDIVSLRSEAVFLFPLLMPIDIKVEEQRLHQVCI